MMDHLRAQNLIDVSKNGTSITIEGKNVLQALESAMEDWSGRAFIAKRLKKLLGIRSVKVVAGNSESEPLQKAYLEWRQLNNLPPKLVMARQLLSQVEVQLHRFRNI